MRRLPGGAIGAVPSNGSPEACASRWRTVEPGGPAGSSRSSVPSSAATSIASAVIGFVTEAQRKALVRSPRSARTPSGVSAATATFSAGQRSTSFNPCTAGDTTTAMQIYPPSITGDGFAAGGSVLEHKFGQGDPYTLGVEEEYMLLDPESYDLVQHIDTVLASIAGHELEPQVKPELMQSVLEIATPVCRTAGDVDRELRKLREYVTSVAQGQNLRVGSAGTHPFSLFERQRITARDRYRNLVDQLQYVARRELIFGLHVHVAVDDPDKAIHVMSALLTHLSELLALSASSPFWRGEATGLASSRQMVFAAFPRSGPPPRFRDYADYAEVVGQLEKTGC